MSDVVVIGSRFCGPRQSGNGGYSCGLCAAPLRAPAQVTLRLPPPLDTPLQRVVTGERAQLLDGDRLIAEAQALPLELEVPRPPSAAEAQAAVARFPAREAHPFPHCFVCGTAREPGDGLRLFTGPIGRDGIVATPWVPGADLADADGRVRPEFVWSAIDCPGSWAVDPRPAQPIVLGRMHARIDALPRAGTPCIVIGWPIARDGRKHEVGSALFGADGSLLACARAIWIALRPAP